MYLTLQVFPADCRNCIDPPTGPGLPSVTRMTRSKIDPEKRRPWESLQRLRAGRAILAALLLVMCASALMARPPKTQKHERRHEIDHLEEAWRTAMLKNDSGAMSGLLSEDYMGITPTGTLQTKQEALVNLHRVHITSLEISDRHVRFYGNTALVTSTADIAGTGPEGNDISGSYRYTRVYVEGPPGVWKIVSFEANKILTSADRPADDHK